MSQRSLFTLLIVGGLSIAGSHVHADNPPKITPKPPTTMPVEAPKQPAAPPAAKPEEPSCKLVDAEVPRGGRLDVTGERFGQAPVVRIDGKPARILERREDRISVQVAADSNGGPVTVQAGKMSAHCGTLVIIGKDRD